MNHDWKLYVALFACAFAASILATPYSKTIAIKIGAIDYPRKRGMHKDPIPRLGGIAIVFGFAVAMFVALFFISELRSVKFAGFTVGAIIIVCLGIIDDTKQLKAKTKLVFQLLAAGIVVMTGTRIDLVNWPFLMNLSFLSIPVTILWIVGVTNAVNLIDGLDGLAAGVSSIASLCLVALCVLTGEPLAVALTASLAGSCLGFLPRNFAPAEVIMGDTGATFLGFVLAVSSIMGVFKTYALISVLIAVLALGLPIFDTAFAMCRRFIKGRPIMEADRGHIHHRLVDAGFSHKQTVIIIYVVSIIFAIAAILLAIGNVEVLLASTVILFVFILMILVYRKRTIGR